MKQLILSVIAGLLLTAQSASATQVLPDVFACKMTYKVKSVNVIVGLNWGDGTISCDGEEPVAIKVAGGNFPAIGIWREEGTVYAYGLGWNSNHFLGALVTYGAALAVGNHGGGVDGAIYLDTGLNAALGLVVSKTNGLGARLGWGVKTIMTVEAWEAMQAANTSCTGIQCALDKQNNRK